MKKVSLAGLALLFCLLCPAAAQQEIPYQRLLLLIAGPSGDRITRDEQEVVNYLNNLRSDYNLYNLQMGTMHFDRRAESRILTETLGFSRNAGVVVGLVQLDNQGMPVRTVYKREGVTAADLQAEHREFVGRWSKLSGQSVPAELQLASQPQAPNDPPMRPENPPPTQDTAQPPPEQPKGEEIYSFEGIRSVVTDLNNRVDSLWSDLRNRPLREDRLDVPVREATVELQKASAQLLQAHQRGVVYPTEQLAAVRAAGRKWRLAEPQFYLPVPLRGEVEPIEKLLKQAEAIEYQGRNS